MSIADGMRALPWPSDRKGKVNGWAHAREFAGRKGDFIVEPESALEAAERDKKYRRRRLKCAMAELYTNFGAWAHAGRGEQAIVHLNAAVKAHAALKALGADKIFRTVDPG